MRPVATIPRRAPVQEWPESTTSAVEEVLSAYERELGDHHLAAKVSSFNGMLKVEVWTDASRQLVEHCSRVVSQLPVSQIFHQAIADGRLAFCVAMTREH